MSKSIEDYVRKIVTINFFAINTRLDIQYIVNRFTERNTNPSKEHFIVLKNLWRYIAETKELTLAIGRLEYTLKDLDLYTYENTSFVDDLIMRVSTGNHIVFLAGYPVTWKSKKQTIV